MGDIILEIIGYTTARAIIPFVTFGKVRVEKIKDHKYSYNWGLAKEESGKYVMDSLAAGWVGVFFWIAVAIIAFSFR